MHSGAEEVEPFERCKPHAMTRRYKENDDDDDDGASMTSTSPTCA